MFKSKDADKQIYIIHRHHNYRLQAENIGGMLIYILV